MTPAAPILRIGSVLAALALVADAGRGEGARAPHFELLKWESTEKVKLADFAGAIVVLDFFAYWCAPCRKASTEIEGGIGRYYAAKQGNPHGVPVRVVAVNIERDNPKQTTKFIQATGSELVLNDPQGALLDQLGGKATPFIVVLDGTRATRETPDFLVRYRNEGFEGTRRLRQVIDAIKPPPGPAAEAPNEPGVIEEATGLPITRRADLTFEAMLASDIQLTSTTLNYGQQRGSTEWKLGYTHNTLTEDYEPFALFDFLGYAEHLQEEYNAWAASVRQSLGASLTGQMGGGGYLGFADYRSLWLANYYRQQFHFVPGYSRPDPGGYNVSTGLRWAYLPATGFAEVTFLYAHDAIAPGYEFEPLMGELLNGRERLDTYAPTLQFENIVSRRVRMLNELQLTFTTGRETRYAYRGSVNVALGERWVWRTLGGYTREDPALRAWFIGSTLEFALTDRWLLNVSGLCYQDTGEIENSTFLSTAAPGLQTWQGGVGLRYAGEVSSFSVSVAPLLADYKPIAVGTRPFTHLYRDRTWIAVQAAYSLVF